MGLRIGACWWMVALFWLGLAQGRVAAQADRAVDQRAKLLFDLGVTASQQDRWQDAELLFERSLEVLPKSATFLNLAVVRSRLGKAQAAMRALDAFDEVVMQEDLKRRAKWLRGELASKLQQHAAGTASTDATLAPLLWKGGELGAELSPVPWTSLAPAELSPVPWGGAP